MQKRLIDVSEGPDVRDATLDIGTSLNKLPFGVIFSLYFQRLEKVRNTLNSESIANENSFQLVPVSRMMNLSSVERKWRTDAKISMTDTETSLKRLLI